MEEQKEKKEASWVSILRALRSRRMLTIFLLGFSSGLPIMLVASNLRLWLRREGIELDTIGFMAWLMIPYSLNFLWAPLLDRFSLSKLGRRRSWIILTQLGLFASIFAFGFGDPSQSLSLIVFLGFLVALLSATQDVAVDAYRREILPDQELGLGAALGVYGYRIAMLVAQGLGLWVVDQGTLDFSFNQSFMMIACFMGVGLFASVFLAKEPELQSQPRSLSRAVIEPFYEFFTRRGAVLILLFILLFKIGDSMAGALLNPFYADMGFSNRDIAEVAKTFGFFSSMTGLFIGGAGIFYLGIYRCLWIFGIFQGLTTLSFAWLSTIEGPTWAHLAVVVALEDSTSGMGTAALVAFISTMANRKFTAAQYALFSSLASMGRTFFSGFSGVIATALGYTQYFIFCASLAIPGLILLHFMIRLQKQVVQKETSDTPESR